MSTKTVRHELANFLTPRLSPEVMMEFNSWLADSPSVAAWIDVPEHRRVNLLEAEGVVHARNAHRTPGTGWHE